MNRLEIQETITIKPQARFPSYYTSDPEKGFDKRDQGTYPPLLKSYLKRLTIQSN
jgi:hypothetical protein